MTLLQSPRSVEPVKQTETSSPTPATAKPALEARRRVVAGAVIGLAVVIGAWGIFAIFEGPVAGTWNRMRQHQLGSELSAQRSHVGAGAAIAVFQVPRLGINLVVAEGDSPQQLRGGPGHRIGTPLPGDRGNSIIAGHRIGWGGSFSDIKSLKKGDLIVVQTQDATNGPRNAVFKVISTTRVPGGDTSALGKSTDHRITIVTSVGGQFSDAQLQVVAVSGPVGKLARPASDVTATTPAGSRLWNAQTLLALVGLGGALIVAWLIRRRYRLAVVLVAVVPLLALGLLGLLLNLDLFLPVLR